MPEKGLGNGGGDVDLGDVPAGNADHRGGALQVGRGVGDSQGLRFAWPEGDVVALPDRGLQLVVAGEFLAARPARRRPGAGTRPSSLTCS